MSKSKQIQQNLKKLLFEHDLTPTELARQIDLPQQTIQRIVKGKIKNPHQKTLEIISDYFKINIKELTGENDIILFPDNDLQTTKSKFSTLTIPVYLWEQLGALQSDQNMSANQNIMVNATYDKKTFGVIMNDSSMTPYFPKDSILVIEPNKTKEDRSFILVYLDNSKKFLFRQLLSDGENYFLKALNSDLSNFPVRKLEQEDKIIGVLVETRQTYFKTLGIE